MDHDELCISSFCYDCDCDIIRQIRLDQTKIIKQELQDIFGQYPGETWHRIYKVIQKVEEDIYGTRSFMP